MNALLESLVGPQGIGGSAETARPLKALAWARASTDMQEER